MTIEWEVIGRVIYALWEVILGPLIGLAAGVSLGRLLERADHRCVALISDLREGT